MGFENAIPTAAFGTEDHHIWTVVPSGFMGVAGMGALQDLGSGFAGSQGYLEVRLAWAITRPAVLAVSERFQSQFRYCSMVQKQGAYSKCPSSTNPMI